MAARQFRVQLPLFAGTLAVTVAGSALWIPSHGLAGAVEATIAGLVVLAAGAALALARGLRARARVAAEEPR
jgi:hypothetical protein